MLLLEDVKKSYVEANGQLLPILDIPHFKLDRGDQVVLSGPSGCGKTTLLHVIAGISSADSGVVFLDGVNITALSEAGRDRYRALKLGYVFQTFNLLPAFTALENVLLGMTFGHSRKDPRRARHLLERVGLADRAHHKPTALSVGEQQRVAVAPRWPIDPNCCWRTSPRPTWTAPTSRRSSILFARRAARRTSRC